jgi:hypothetical protein
MPFCSRFLQDVETKHNQVDRHEATAMNEPPSSLSIFANIDYTKKGFTVESLSRSELQRMRHYILQNYVEATPWIK